MTIKVVVTGDVSVDWYYWPGPSYSSKEDVNWELYEGIDANPQSSGAIFLAEWLRDLLQIRTGGSPYLLASQSCEDIIGKNNNEMLHIYIHLDLFPPFSFNGKKEEVKVYWAKNYLGHISPENERQYPAPLKIYSDQKDADLVIIFDRGNGFRFEEQVWPEALKGDQKPIVIYNTYPPLLRSCLKTSMKFFE